MTNIPTTVPAPPVPPYASWIEGRAEGTFKTHTTIGHLKNALHCRARTNRETRRTEYDTTMGVFTLHDGRYVLWMTLAEGTSPSEYPLLFG